MPTDEAVLWCSQCREFVACIEVIKKHKRSGVRKSNVVYMDARKHFILAPTFATQKFLGLTAKPKSQRGIGG